MQTQTFDLPIRSFLQAVGDAVPTPGGGSVAALVAALGTAMASMAGNFTKGPKYAEYETAMEEAVKRMADAMDACERLLEADIESFDGYMAALKLPKASEQEKAARREAIRSAALRAVDIPIRLMEVCREALTVAERMAGTANKNVISDLGIGALLLESAARSAWLTVEINLASLDEELRGPLAQRAEACLKEAEALMESTVRQVRERIWS